MAETRVVNVELSALIEQVREISIEVPLHITDEEIDIWLRAPKNVDWLHDLADDDEIPWQEAPGFPERKKRKAGVLFCYEGNGERLSVPGSLVASLERGGGEPSKAEISADLQRLFHAEIENEHIDETGCNRSGASSPGGDYPATLQSSLESLKSGLFHDDESMNVTKVSAELQALIKRFGGNAEVKGFVSIR